MFVCVLRVSAYPLAPWPRAREIAVQSLPIGAAYLGKVEIVSKFDAYADTGCEGTAISRRRAKG